MNKYQSYIRKHATKRELLELLAEESTELAQASLKLIRATEGANPTPITKFEAVNNLHEEIDDVFLVWAVYEGIYIDEDEYPKLKRWAERLEFNE